MNRPLLVINVLFIYWSVLCSTPKCVSMKLVMDQKCNTTFTNNLNMLMCMHMHTYTCTSTQNSSQWARLQEKFQVLSNQLKSSNKIHQNSPYTQHLMLPVKQIGFQTLSRFVQLWFRMKLLGEKIPQLRGQV